VFPVGRRDFLKLVGLSAVAASCEVIRGDGTTSYAVSDLPIDASLAAIRKEDFVLLRFDFINFVPDGHRLVMARKRSGPGFIIVNFQSQHLFEEAFPEDSAKDDAGNHNGTTPSPPPVGSRLSGPSRLAFAIPDKIHEIPRSLSGLLDLIGKLDLNVTLNATPPGEREVTVVVKVPPPLPVPPPGHRPPWRMTRALRAQRAALAQRFFHLPPALPPKPVVTTQTFTPHAPQLPHTQETAIELPFRLLLSPNRSGAWAHADDPVSHNGRIELWHTRLGTRDQTTGGVDELTPDLRTVRAVWTRDPGFQPAAAAPTTRPDDDPARVFDVNGVNGHESLTDIDRARIVQLTSNFDRYTAPNEPVPAAANLLMLTSMGGWLDVRGDWPNTQDRLLSWEHRATFGRDHFVKKVELAVLYPFGHQALVITITERKFKAEHEHIAYLRKRMFIVIKEPQKDYTVGRDMSSAVQSDLRTMPFLSVKLTTLVSPNLDAANIGDNDANNPFVPLVGGEPFRFRMEGLDVEGNVIRFLAPVVIVPASGIDATGRAEVVFSQVQTAQKYYDTKAQTYDGLTSFDTLCPLHGQRVAYAPSAQPDDTAFETDSIAFVGALYADTTDVPPNYPQFLPVLGETNLVPEAVRHISGEHPLFRFKYHGLYHDVGFDGATNAGELVLAVAAADQTSSFTQPLVSFKNKADRSGGFLSPSFELAALSRHIGPVAGHVPGPFETPADPTAAAALGNFKPSEFFSSLSRVPASLFGVLKLSDLFADILDATGLDQAPKYFSRVVSGAFGVFTDLEALSNDLQQISFTGTSVTNAIGTVLDDIQTAVDPTSAAAAAAAARNAIAGDVATVVTALGTVQATLAAMPGLSNALRADLASRAASLAGTLSGAVADLVAQLADLNLAADLPKEIHTTMRWRGKVKSWAPDGFFKDFFVPVDPTTTDRAPTSDGTADSLLLVVDVRAKTAGGDPQVNLKCTLENFKLNLFGTNAQFLTLDFDLLEFSVELGKKPDASVSLHGITFAGPLAFIETLKNLIPLQGFSDPPNIKVDTDGLTASISAALPSVAIGIFSLENISFGAAINIPFIGLGSALTFSFNFATRENPFNLTVALLGGGGFFGIKISPQGVEMLEAALEAGARVSIDLGVASGSVSAMLGIYFRIETTESGTDEASSKKQLSLTGYFRVRGEVDVLGLITASITLSLSLTFQPDSGKVSGTASLEIEIDILFFSESVTVTCQRQFAGSNGDPSFFDVMHPKGNFRPWNDYLEAFAA
jgi:hypothetical protein